MAKVTGMEMYLAEAARNTKKYSTELTALRT